MRLIERVADHTMMVPGYEHQTHECPGCHEVERRLVFVKPIEPLSVEPMQLSSPAPESTTAPKSEEDERADAPSADAPSADAPSTDAPSTCALSTWERALDRLRSQQSSLKQRAPGAKTSETRRPLHQSWGFVPLRQAPPPPKPQTPAQEPTQSSPATGAPAHDGTQHAATPTGALARVAAKLRSHQATMSARIVVKERSLEGRPSDQTSENVSSSPRRPTSSGKSSPSRPMPLPRSRSLVPIDARPAQAPTAWTRAVAMLQHRQGSAP
jgi:hypothetical protein